MTSTLSRFSLCEGFRWLEVGRSFAAEVALACFGVGEVGVDFLGRGGCIGRSGLSFAAFIRLIWLMLSVMVGDLGAGYCCAGRDRNVIASGGGSGSVVGACAEGLLIVVSQAVEEGW